jgi:hypothetical protein
MENVVSLNYFCIHVTKCVGLAKNSSLEKGVSEGHFRGIYQGLSNSHPPQGRPKSGAFHARHHPVSAIPGAADRRNRVIRTMRVDNDRKILNLLDSAREAVAVYTFRATCRESLNIRADNFPAFLHQFG